MDEKKKEIRRSFEKFWYQTEPAAALKEWKELHAQIAELRQQLEAYQIIQTLPEEERIEKIIEERVRQHNLKPLTSPHSRRVRWW